jgi:hypothetical protein
MLPKNILISWVRKLIYSWLIFCVGGVGSLTYFDGFLPGHEHGEHPFHLSVFEEANHHHDHLPAQSEPENVAQQLRLWLVNRFMPSADFLLVSQHLAPGLAQFFSSGLSDGYILTETSPKIFNLHSLVGSLVPRLFIGRSARLAPPEKPPSVHLAS